MVSDKGIMCKSGVTCEHMDSCFSEPSENLTTNDFVTYNTFRLVGRIYLSYPFDKRDRFSFPFQHNLNSPL